MGLAHSESLVLAHPSGLCWVPSLRVACPVPSGRGPAWPSASSLTPGRKVSRALPLWEHAVCGARDWAGGGPSGLQGGRSGGSLGKQVGVGPFVSIRLPRSVLGDT